MTDAARFQRLSLREGLWLGVLLALGRGWIFFDQDLLPERMLLPVFLVLVLLLMVGYFALVRPAAPYALARTVALALAIVVTALIVVQHVILVFDLSYKSAIVLAATVTFPFVAAAGYKWVNTRS